MKGLKGASPYLVFIVVALTLLERPFLGATVVGWHASSAGCVDDTHSALLVEVLMWWREVLGVGERTLVASCLFIEFFYGGALLFYSGVHCMPQGMY